VSPVKYELGFYIPEDDILHSHRRGNLKSYTLSLCSTLTVRDHVSHQLEDKTLEMEMLIEV
jgi:hypothetical protein